MSTPIEISDEPLPFDKELWIGKGRKVPENLLEVDQALFDYCNGLHDIPIVAYQNFTREDYSENIPSLSIPQTYIQCCKRVQIMEGGSKTCRKAKMG
jgi:hypothetical protein